MSYPATSLPPGFRFYPTDEELILHYLRNRAASLPCPVSIIADVDIYKFDPWDLPAKAMFGEQEWYFFSPLERKYPNGVRPNRTAASGYWKATGTDKPILRSKGNESIGVKKALVFYKGRPPKGLKTGWIMHEYRLADAHNHSSSKPANFRDSSMRLDDWVLCRIYKKSSRLPVDREQEDPGGEDVYLPNVPNTTEQNSFKLQKSSSLSKLLDAADYSLLSRLFDNTSELPEFKQGHLGYASSNQPLINNSNDSNGNSYLLEQLSRTDFPVLIAENYPTRRARVDGCLEEDGGPLHPLKKQSNSYISNNSTNQFESMQNSLLNQPFFNQQWQLNSHLGLHGGHT